MTDVCYCMELFFFLQNYARPRMICFQGRSKLVLQDTIVMEARKDDMRQSSVEHTDNGLFSPQTNGVLFVKNVINY